MKVLIVEDEAIVALSLKFLLEMDGHEVCGTPDDVQTAVTAAEANHPQLAFVDIQLAHGASGFDVAAELKSRGVFCIFLTGNPPDRPMPELALGCLSKPYSDEALAGAIRVAEAAVQGQGLPQPPSGLMLYHDQASS